MNTSTITNPMLILINTRPALIEWQVGIIANLLAERRQNFLIINALLPNDVYARQASRQYPFASVALVLPKQLDKMCQCMVKSLESAGIPVATVNFRADAPDAPESITYSTGWLSATDRLKEYFQRIAAPVAINL